MQCYRNYCAKHRDHVNAYYRERYATNAVARSKQLARARANHRFRRLGLEKQPCQQCGNPGEKHHANYDEPHEYEWLCHKCHMRMHQRMAVA
jgi:hypothetical protein